MRQALMRLLQQRQCQCLSKWRERIACHQQSLCQLKKALQSALYRKKRLAFRKWRGGYDDFDTSSAANEVAPEYFGDLAPFSELLVTMNSEIEACEAALEVKELANSQLIQNLQIANLKVHELQNRLAVQTNQSSTAKLPTKVCHIAAVPKYATTSSKPLGMAEARAEPHLRMDTTIGNNVQQIGPTRFEMLGATRKNWAKKLGTHLTTNLKTASSKQ